MPKELSSDLVGLSFQPITTSWKSKDAILYALGVGATLENEIDFLYEGKGPKVLPTYAVIPGMLAMAGLFNEVTVNPLMILHGEQGITLHRALPPDAEVNVTGKITAVWDKEKAAVVVIEGIGEDKSGPLFTSRSSIFIRGAGGFGGERGPSSPASNVPNRAPDKVVKATPGLDQAALYRLSGDLNPLHIDPDFAKMAGFDAPFIHGLCTYGFVGRAILAAYCDYDPTKFKSFDVRFAERVYPGDEITTQIWDEGNGNLIVSAVTKRGTVLSQATATIETS